jgi:hypothetical protein
MRAVDSKEQANGKRPGSAVISRALSSALAQFGTHQQVLVAPSRLIAPLSSAGVG